MQQIGIQPLSKGMRFRILLLDFLVTDDFSLLCIHEEELARMQPLLPQDMRLIQIQHTDL